SAENALLIKAREISLIETPATKASPPLCPTLMLCLMMENNTGPTAILNSNPRVNPFSKASIILPARLVKFFYPMMLNFSGRQKLIPTLQQIAFHNPGEFVLTTQFATKLHKF